MSIKRLANASITGAGGKSSKLWDQTTTMGTYESIATATVDSSGASSISFGNLPQNYVHLQLRYSCRGVASSGTEATMIYASPHAANGYYHYLQGDGASIASGNSGGLSFATLIGYMPNNANSTYIFSGGIIDILDYSSSSKIKTYRGLSGFDSNGSGWVSLHSGINNDISPITTLTMSNNSATNLAPGSTFALYGIRGA
jgi:hypothetical protein